MEFKQWKLSPKWNTSFLICMWICICFEALCIQQQEKFVSKNSFKIVVFIVKLYENDERMASFLLCNASETEP